MRVGITLPQFRDEADSALDAARRAEALGIDGVFCFDHLWPMGQPGRPALSSGPLLGALVVKSLGEAAKLLAGDAPGLDLIIYGAVLVLVIWFAPRGLIGGRAHARKLLMRRTAPATSSPGETRYG